MEVLSLNDENTLPVEETTLPSDSYTEPLATEVQVVIVQDLESYVNDIVHVNLFGSFLICGCLCAIALFRWWRK